MRNTVCVAIESFSYKCKTKQGLRQCTRSLYRLQIEYVTPLVMFFCLWLFFDISSGIHFRVTHTELQAYTLKNTTHGSRHALQANSSNCCYKFSPSYLYPASSTKVHVPICHVALAELSRKQQCASGRWLSINPLSVLCYSVDADAPGSEAGASVDPTGGYTCVPVTHSRGLGPDHFDSQIDLRPHPATGSPAAPPAQTPALAVHPPQAGWGGGHQTLPLPVRELWALVRPPGQAGEAGDSRHYKGQSHRHS